MPVEVLVGTAIAVVLLFLSAIGPHEWKSPRGWRVPEPGPSLIVWFGANAVTAAIRLGVILVEGKIGVRGARLHGIRMFESVGSDDGTVLLGGALAALLIGLATIRDAMRSVVPLRAATAATGAKHIADQKPPAG